MVCRGDFTRGRTDRGNRNVLEVYTGSSELVQEENRDVVSRVNGTCVVDVGGPVLV